MIAGYYTAVSVVCLRVQQWCDGAGAGADVPSYPSLGDETKTSSDTILVSVSVALFLIMALLRVALLLLLAYCHACCAVLRSFSVYQYSIRFTFGQESLPNALVLCLCFCIIVI